MTARTRRSARLPQVPRRHPCPHHTDEGSSGILTLGLTVLALMVILVVASATSVHVSRLRLAHLADELAIDAADALDTVAYFAAGPGDDPRLAQRRMEEAVARHLSVRGTGHLDGVRVVSVQADDAQSARVSVQQVVYPLFGLEALMPFANGITLSATGQSRSF